MNILIPMAGLGARFQGTTNTPKPLIPINGVPMIQLATQTLGISGRHIFITQRAHNLKGLLSSTVPYCEVIEIDEVTEGPACTALLAENLINDSTPLIIANCDQIMHWDTTLFSSFVSSFPYDGFMVTYTTRTPKNSYVTLDTSGFVTRVAEKQVISDISTNGIHFWSHGSDFIKSANAMIKSNERYNNEFYIAPTYNSLIKEGKKISIYHIPTQQHFAVGVPDDLEAYRNLPHFFRDGIRAPH